MPRPALDHEHPVDADRVARARDHLLSADDAARLASLLSLMADPVRSRVLDALDLVGELCVGDLALALGTSEDAVGYGLRILRTAGLVQTAQGGPGRLLPAGHRLPRTAAGALPAPTGGAVARREHPGGRVTEPAVHDDLAGNHSGHDHHDHAGHDHDHGRHRPRPRRPRPRPRRPRRARPQQPCGHVPPPVLDQPRPGPARRHLLADDPGLVRLRRADLPRLVVGGPGLRQHRVLLRRLAVPGGRVERAQGPPARDDAADRDGHHRRLRRLRRHRSSASTTSTSGGSSPR